MWAMYGIALPLSFFVFVLYWGVSQLLPTVHCAAPSCVSPHGRATARRQCRIVTLFLLPHHGVRTRNDGLWHVNLSIDACRFGLRRDSLRHLLPNTRAEFHCDGGGLSRWVAALFACARLLVHGLSAASAACACQRLMECVEYVMCASALRMLSLRARCIGFTLTRYQRCQRRRDATTDALQPCSSRTGSNCRRQPPQSPSAVSCHMPSFCVRGAGLLPCLSPVVIYPLHGGFDWCVTRHLKRVGFTVLRVQMILHLMAFVFATTDENGNRYIYSSLDWSDPDSTGRLAGIIVFVAVPVVNCIFWASANFCNTRFGHDKELEMETA